MATTGARRSGRTSRTRAPEKASGAHRPRRLAGLAHVGVQELKGVGPRRAAALGKLGIESVLDLLWHVPRRYLDRSLKTPIGDLGGVRLSEDAQLTVVATVRDVRRRQVRRRLTLHEVTLADDTGSLRASWFNQNGLARRLEPGTVAAFSGKLSWFRGRPKLDVQAVETLSAAGDTTGRVVPVHAASKEIGTGVLRDLVAEALERAGPLYDPLPGDLVARHGLVSRTEAFRQIHFPDDLASAGRARTRLVYDELFVLEVGLALRKRHLEATEQGLVHEAAGPLRRALEERLPFALTGAQERVLADIDSDLRTPRPMHRLLQGEVGSGKTIIAAFALLSAVDAGRQAAIMAPTEVLAEQHHESIGSLLDGLTVPADDNLLGERPLRVGLLTNRTSGAERADVLEATAAGLVDVLIGTHALIQEGVSIPDLGVAVVDEQHRFGVHQRVALTGRAEKGPAHDRARDHAPDRSAGRPAPDMLIMTATPIPRTLAMTLYGDLDVSVLDELPPGRQAIATRVVRSGEDRGSAYAHVRTEVSAGRQAYVICPLVEESQALEAKSAVSEFERLRDGELAGLRLGLLHGQLRPAEKHEVMGRFHAGEVDVLVATTVVEVGVNVPNATILVVEDADRFGLSQLHQLRGRIGRGAHASTCYLFADPQTPEAEQRMTAMARTNDGFELAEVDLRIRGEGSLFGARQSGVTDLHVARLLEDFEWVQRARSDAFALVGDDPDLSEREHGLLRDEVATVVGRDVEWLLKS